MTTAPSPEDKYQQRVQSEIEHYTQEYQNEESRRTLTQHVPPSWKWLQAQADQLIRQANNGRNYADEIEHHLRARPGSKAVSLGSGPGGVEVEIARRLTGHAYEIVCLDLNPNLMKMGEERAKAEGLNLRFEAQDLNYVTLEKEQYDVVMCHASLHHLINLEHVAYEISQALKPDGILITVDIVTRNGYRMWDETYTFVNALWRLLPPQYRRNHTAYTEPQVDEYYENRDYGGDSMECARSAEILPILDEYLQRRVFVPHMAISRRFFDTMYGPNYDVERDLSFLKLIWELDVRLLELELLKPETFFGIYTKGPEKPRPPLKPAYAVASDTLPASTDLNPDLPLALQVVELKGRVAILEARLNTFYNTRAWKLWQSIRHYPRLAGFMRRWMSGK